MDVDLPTHLEDRELAELDGFGRLKDFAEVPRRRLLVARCLMWWLRTAISKFLMCALDNSWNPIYAAFLPSCAVGCSPVSSVMFSA
jgi:hypothetical protein